MDLLHRLPPVLLLDLDDTILTFTAGARDYWAEAFAAHAADLPGVAADAFRAAVRHAADAFWADRERAARERQDLFAARRHIVRGAFERLGYDPGLTGDHLADHYTRTKEDACEPFPGAIEALTTFRERGIHLGLITNGASRFQRAKLERHDLERFFEIVLIEGEFGAGKPDASVFRAALEHFDALPDQAWMVGDNLYADIAGAQAIGIPGIWHDYSRAGLGDAPHAVPHRVIYGLHELL